MYVRYNYVQLTLLSSDEVIECVELHVYCVTALIRVLILVLCCICFDFCTTCMYLHRSEVHSCTYIKYNKTQ